MYKTSKIIITHAIMKENPQITQTELKKKLFLRFYCDDFNEQQKEKILTHLENYYSQNLLTQGNSCA